MVEGIRTAVAEQIKHAQDQQKKQADHCFHPVDFDVSDKVWLSLHHYCID